MASRLFLTNYLNSKGYASATNGTILRDGDVTDGRLMLRKDRDAFFTNCILTYASAIYSVQRENYSWAFVQCYYCLFYMAKSLLADSDYAFFYNDKGKALSVKIASGESFCKEDGNSHQIVLKLYKKVFEGDSFLCGEIDDVNIIDWYNKKREEINYRLSPMPDPEVPSPLQKYNEDLRGWITTYMGDSLYAYSAEHSYMAYTTLLIDYVIKRYKERNQKNEYITEKVIRHLRKNMKDTKGSFDFFIKRFLEISENDS